MKEKEVAKFNSNNVILRKGEERKFALLIRISLKILLLPLQVLLQRLQRLTIPKSLSLSLIDTLWAKA